MTGRREEERAARSVYIVLRWLGKPSAADTPVGAVRAKRTKTTTQACFAPQQSLSTPIQHIAFDSDMLLAFSPLDHQLACLGEREVYHAAVSCAMTHTKEHNVHKRTAHTLDYCLLVVGASFLFHKVGRSFSKPQLPRRVDVPNQTMRLLPPPERKPAGESALTRATPRPLPTGVHS